MYLKNQSRINELNLEKKKRKIDLIKFSYLNSKISLILTFIC